MPPRDPNFAPRVWTALVLSLFLLSSTTTQPAHAQPPDEDPISTLLDSPEEEKRIGLLRQLARGEVAVEPAERKALAQALCLYLEEEDTKIRVLAMAALRRLGTRVPTLETILVESLKCSDPRVRAEASFALGAFGGKSAVRHLTHALGDKDSKVTAAALRGLVKVLAGSRSAAKQLAYLPGTQGLKPLFSDPRVAVRLDALSVLELLPTRVADEFEAELISSLRDASPSVRLRAVQVANRTVWEDRYSYGSLRILRAFLSLLKDSDSAVQEFAAKSVAIAYSKRYCAGPFSSCAVCNDRFPELDLAVPLLAADLSSSDARVRNSSREALKHLGPRASAAATALLERLEIEVLLEAKAHLVLTLAAVRAPEEVVAPLLRGLVLNERLSPGLRRDAAKALATAYDPSEHTLAALRIAEPQPVDFRAMLLKAQALAGAPALPDLKRFESDPRPEIRMAVAEAGGVLGPAAVQLLVRLSREADPNVRASAVRALGVLVDSPAATEHLFAVLTSDPNDDVRDAAARVLADHAQASRSVTPKLAEVVDDDPATMTRVTAIRALVKIRGRRVEPAFPALVRATLSLDEDVRVCARWALDRLGKKRASKKLPVLPWVLPQAYQTLVLAFCVALLVWCALARRFPRRAPERRALRLLQFAIVVGTPALLASWAVRWALEPAWTRFFLPKDSVLLLDVPTAAALTAAFAAALPATWAALRRSHPGEDLGDVPALEQEAAALAAARPNESDPPHTSGE